MILLKKGMGWKNPWFDSSPTRWFFPGHVACHLRREGRSVYILTRQCDRGKSEVDHIFFIFDGFISKRNAARADPVCPLSFFAATEEFVVDFPTISANHVALHFVTETMVYRAEISMEAVMKALVVTAIFCIFGTTPDIFDLVFAGIFM